MRVGVFMFGGVEMIDAGAQGADPLDRRYDQAAIDDPHHELLRLTAGQVSVGSYDNPSAAEADRLNREVTEESLDVLELAMSQESFTYSGKHFCLPPPGIPDRGGEVTELSLVPRPAHPFE